VLLLKTGPFKSYAPPNRYGLLKVKATFASVQDEVEYSEFLWTTSPFPFAYDGSCLVEGKTLVPDACDVSMFTVQSLVAVEVSILAYRMGYSFGMPSWSGTIHAKETERGLYHKSPEAALRGGPVQRALTLPGEVRCRPSILISD